MNEQQWRLKRDDRSLRYAGRVLHLNRPILLSVDHSYAARYDGQVAILTASNLLGRMTPAVALDIPDLPIVAPLPHAGRSLREFIHAMLFAADPFGHFECRSYKTGDYIIRIGSKGPGYVVHGSGWNCYYGPSPSPLFNSDYPNPVGPAMSAIITIANVFNFNYNMPEKPFILDCLRWHSEIAEKSNVWPQQAELSDIWVVGTGSVGTAILYFLTLVTRQFSLSLIDKDIVEIHNLDRSPIFTEAHLGQNKVDAAKGYLTSVGMTDVIAEVAYLDESRLWKERQQGKPDIVVSAANERNVRSIIENSFPPLQIYGTTGGNWQASVIRHAPMIDPCSVCLFPDTSHTPTSCATGALPANNGDQVDAALPFLSFAAGAMAAAEILKLSLPGFPFSENRTVLNTMPWPRIVQVPLTERSGCICQRRSKTVHRQMIEKSRYQFK